jgi:hypothetical protein
MNHLSIEVYEHLMMNHMQLYLCFTRLLHDLLLFNKDNNIRKWKLYQFVVILYQIFIGGLVMDFERRIIGISFFWQGHYSCLAN